MKTYIIKTGRLVATVVGLSLFCHAVVNAQPSQLLLALSKTNHTLALVDPATLKVLATVPVGEDPHEVIASDDGKLAIVTNYGGGSLHELDLIDLVAKKPLASVDTRPLFGPHGAAFANGKFWFTAEGSKSIGSFDPATGKIDWSMGTGQDRTHMIYVSADAKKIYTTNVSSGTVSILEQITMQPGRFGPPPNGGQPNGGQPNAGRPNGGPPPGGPNGGRPRSDWEQTVVPTFRGSEGFDVSPDSAMLWTASGENGSITVIDLKGKKQAAQFDGKIPGANRLKFTPDGKQVFVTSLQSGDLAVYDARTYKEIKRIHTGHGAAGILMDEKGSRAFVACSSDDYISIVDLKTLTVTGRLEVGGVPDGMAWAMIP